MKNTRKGATLIEIGIVVAILAIIFGVVIAQLSKARETQALKASVQIILSSLSKAKSQTLSSLNSSQYGVHFDSDKVIIFKGTSYSVGASDNESIEIATPATVSTISLGGSSDVYFARLTGKPSATGTVTVSNGSSSKVITISATGTFSTN